MTNSILNSTYEMPNRPISQNELKYLHKKLFTELRLSDLYVRHSKCGHIYTIKIGSKKEISIKNGNTNDVGNCSVCWKLKNTEDDEMYNKASDVVKYYTNSFKSGVNPESLIILCMM